MGDPFRLVPKKISPSKGKNHKKLHVDFIYVLKHDDNLPYVSWFFFVVVFFYLDLQVSLQILQPLNRELYTMNPTTFFDPAFLKAINDNTEQSFRSIVSEPSPGIFVFDMFQPRFCELLLSEVLYHFNYHCLWYNQ